MTFQDVMDLNESDFKKYLNQMITTLPIEVTDEDSDMYRQILGKLLIETNNHLSELTYLYGVAKFTVRSAKRNLSKEEYENYVDKRDLIEVYMSTVKETNKTVSRLITLKQMEISENSLCDFRKG